MSTSTPTMKPPDAIGEATDRALIRSFVLLRNKRKALEAELEKTLAPIKALMGQLEVELLDRLARQGVNSTASDAGTAYRTQRVNVTIADPLLFRPWVIKESRFDLIDWRANAKEVTEFMNETQLQPPGLNISSIFTLGVRASTKKG